MLFKTKNEYWEWFDWKYENLAEKKGELCVDDCIERMDAMSLKMDEDKVSDINGGN